MKGGDGIYSLTPFLEYVVSDDEKFMTVQLRLLASSQNTSRSIQPHCYQITVWIMMDDHLGLE